MPNTLNREDWNEALIQVLISKNEPYNWPEEDARRYVADADFDESYNSGLTPAQALDDDSDYWEPEF